MTPREICFWVLVACVLYTYAGYPLSLLLAARVWQRSCPQRRPFSGSISFVIAAYNEEATIGRRLREILGFLRDLPRAEVIIVSDGSSDRTGAEVRDCGHSAVRLIELPDNRGKALALNSGVDAATGDIVVFADARQSWAEDALQLLLENFADPTIGAVSGDLILHSEAGVMAGVGLYWRYEKWIRSRESAIHSTVGVTGAISAVRRELFRPLAAGTILDDVCWPLQVVMSGYRVVHDSRAHAFDRLPAHPRDEFRRKVRTLSGNLQLVARLPSAVLPWTNPVWFQFISHKVLRLVVPWAILAALALNLTLSGAVYRTVLWAQLALIAVGLIGIGRKAAGFRLASAAGSFIVLNAAAWLAFWVWALGRSDRSWKKVVYTHSA